VLVGSVVVDLMLRVPRLPDRGGDLLASALSIRAGGGMFVLRAAVRGGLASVYAGRHGTGPFGDVVRAALSEAGVETAFAADAGGDTGPCVVLVEPDGERTMVTSNGVEAELGPERLVELHVRGDDAVYVSGYDLAYAVTGPALAAWLPHLPGGPVVICDPGPLAGDIPADVLAGVLARTDVLTLNVREAGLLCGTADPDAVGSVLRPRLAPGGIVVLRSGSQGATLLETGSPATPVPAVPIVTADTTGAGDTHAGALLASRARGLTWAHSVEASNAAVAAFLGRSEH